YYINKINYIIIQNKKCQIDLIQTKTKNNLEKRGAAMDTINLNDLTSGYRERMRRLALMDSLDELAAKQTKDNDGIRLDMRGLGMLTLLYFFERRLSRSYKTSRMHVTEFLLKMTQDTYNISHDKMERITRSEEHTSELQSRF